MLTNYIMECRSRTKLSEMPNLEKKLPSPEVMKCLKFLKPENFEDGNEDCSGSDISDDLKLPPMNTSTIQKMLQAKKLTKGMGERLKAMTEFTEEYKKCLEEIRNETKVGRVLVVYSSIFLFYAVLFLQIPSEIQYESWNEIEKTLKNAVNETRLPEELRKEIEEIFKDEEYLTVGPDLDIPERAGILKEEVIDEEKSEEKTEEVIQEKEFDQMSGMWKMLATSDDMIISPPGYRSDWQNEPHWLDRPGVSWRTREKAREKCEEWMRENID